MFKKVHLRLTLMCAGITTLILMTMSFIFLYVSEDSLQKNHFLSFQRDMSTIFANLEQQSIITHEWLIKIESSNSYYIYITDNGVPFLFNQRNPLPVSETVQQEAEDYYKLHFTTTPLSSYIAYHDEYEFRSSTGPFYYASMGTISHESGNLQVLILSSLEQLNNQINEQRIRFLFINLSAVLLLFIFSFYFTKKLLLPIQKNQEEQVQFISSASHELRTPLAVILSCASACKKANTSEKEGFLDVISSEGFRMSRLIDDMLLLSNADNKTFQIHLAEVELDTLLINSYEAFEAMAKEKQIFLQLQLPDYKIPTFLCDGTRLSQVISILLHNAISYTPAKGTISLAISLDNDRKISILVVDNGSGIPDEEKKNIFRRFYRAEASHSDKDHYGLGLCIASEIITSLKGTIHVKDTLGGGSTFVVTLPL